MYDVYSTLLTGFSCCTFTYSYFKSVAWVMGSREDQHSLSSFVFSVVTILSVLLIWLWHPGQVSSQLLWLLCVKAAPLLVAQSVLTQSLATTVSASFEPMRLSSVTVVFRLNLKTNRFSLWHLCVFEFCTLFTSECSCSSGPHTELSPWIPGTPTTYSGLLVLLTFDPMPPVLF